MHYQNIQYISPSSFRSVPIFPETYPCRCKEFGKGPSEPMNLFTDPAARCRYISYPTGVSLFLQTPRNRSELGLDCRVDGEDIHIPSDE